MSGRRFLTILLALAGILGIGALGVSQWQNTDVVSSLRDASGIDKVAAEIKPKPAKPMLRDVTVREGMMALAGVAPIGTVVEVVAGQRVLGQATTTPDGQWSIPMVLVGDAAPRDVVVRDALRPESGLRMALLPNDSIPSRWDVLPVGPVGGAEVPQIDVATGQSPDVASGADENSPNMMQRAETWLRGLTGVQPRDVATVRNDDGTRDVEADLAASGLTTPQGERQIASRDIRSVNGDEARSLVQSPIQPGTLPAGDVGSDVTAGGLDIAALEAELRAASGIDDEPEGPARSEISELVADGDVRGGLLRPDVPSVDEPISAVAPETASGDVEAGGEAVIARAPDTVSDTVPGTVTPSVEPPKDSALGDPEPIAEIETTTLARSVASEELATTIEPLVVAPSTAVALDVGIEVAGVDVSETELGASGAVDVADGARSDEGSADAVTEPAVAASPASPADVATETAAAEVSTEAEDAISARDDDDATAEEPASELADGSLSVSDPVQVTEAITIEPADEVVGEIEVAATATDDPLSEPVTDATLDEAATLSEQASQTFTSLMESLGLSSPDQMDEETGASAEQDVAAATSASDDVTDGTDASAETVDASASDGGNAPEAVATGDDTASETSAPVTASTDDGWTERVPGASDTAALAEPDIEGQASASRIVSEPASDPSEDDGAVPLSDVASLASSSMADDAEAAPSQQTRTEEVTFPARKPSVVRPEGGTMTRAFDLANLPVRKSRPVGVPPRDTAATEMAAATSPDAAEGGQALPVPASPTVRTEVEAAADRRRAQKRADRARTARAAKRARQRRAAQRRAKRARLAQRRERESARVVRLSTIVAQRAERERATRRRDPVYRLSERAYGQGERYPRIVRGAPSRP